MAASSHDHHHVPISRSAARLGRLSAWGLNLLVVFGVLALIGGAFTVRRQTRNLGSPAHVEAVEGGRAELQTELVNLNQSMESLFQGLLEAQSIAVKARSVVGLHPTPAVADTADLLQSAEVAVAALDDTALASAMLSSAVQVDEALHEARALKTSFREIVHNMDAEASVWARIPSIPPVNARRISSGFGLRRDPFTGQLAWHKGLDLSSPKGTPVRAPAEGRVLRAGRYHGYGLLVEIDHGNGIHTRYGHNSRLLVHPGQMVRRGQVISYVGQTGRASAPHLHYEVLLHGTEVDPQPYVLPDLLPAD